MYKRENIFGKFQLHISVTSMYVLNKYRSSDNNSDIQKNSMCTLYRVSGHNGTVFDGNFLNLRERWVKTVVM